MYCFFSDINEVTKKLLHGLIWKSKKEYSPKVERFFIFLHLKLKLKI